MWHQWEGPLEQICEPSLGWSTLLDVKLMREPNKFQICESLSWIELSLGCVINERGLWNKFVSSLLDGALSWMCHQWEGTYETNLWALFWMELFLGMCHQWEGPLKQSCDLSLRWSSLLDVPSMKGLCNKFVSYLLDGALSWNVPSMREPSETNLWALSWMCHQWEGPLKQICELSLGRISLLDVTSMIGVSETNL